MAILSTQDAIDLLRNSRSEPYGAFVRETIAGLLEAQRTEIEQLKIENKRLRETNDDMSKDNHVMMMWAQELQEKVDALTGSNQVS